MVGEGKDRVGGWVFRHLYLIPVIQTCLNWGLTMEWYIGIHSTF
jgi:hypothetical protein